MSIKNIKDKLSLITSESLYNFVNKYLAQIVYSLCIILVLSLIIIFIKNKESKDKEQLMSQYYQAISMIRNGDNQNAIKTLQEVYNSNSADKNIKIISGMRLADLLSNNGDNDLSLTIYKEIYEFSGVDEFLKNLSGVSALNILINKNDSKDYGEIEKLIAELNNPNNPVLSIVLEKEGIFEIQRGNKEKGLNILKDLLKTDLDDYSKSRVEQIVNTYENI